MPALFEAYVTNLGKYNEGELVGEYLKFPTRPEEVLALLKRIGIDGVRYEEIFITDFDAVSYTHLSLLLTGLQHFHAQRLWNDFGPSDRSGKK